MNTAELHAALHRVPRGSVVLVTADEFSYEAWSARMAEVREGMEALGRPVFVLFHAVPSTQTPEACVGIVARHRDFVRGIASHLWCVLLVMTAPPAVIRALVKHVLTDKGIEGFLADWAKTGQTIG